MTEQTYPECAICDGPVTRDEDGALRHLMEHPLNQHTPVVKVEEHS